MDRLRPGGGERGPRRQARRGERDRRVLGTRGRAVEAGLDQHAEPPGIARNEPNGAESKRARRPPRPSVPEESRGTRTRTSTNGPEPVGLPITGSPWARPVCRTGGCRLPNPDPVANPTVTQSQASTGGGLVRSIARNTGPAPPSRVLSRSSNLASSGLLACGFPILGRRFLSPAELAAKVPASPPPIPSGVRKGAAAMIVGRFPRYPRKRPTIMKPPGPPGRPARGHAAGGPEPADFMITKENRAHRKIFLRDHAGRRGGFLARDRPRRLALQPK